MKSRNTRASTTSTTSTINAKVPTFDEICEKAGFGDLKPADRTGSKPLQRQAVWCVMREHGVKFREIAEQSHRTHGTVVVGVKRFKDFLSVDDMEAVRMYQNVIKAAQNEKE